MSGHEPALSHMLRVYVAVFRTLYRFQRSRDPAIQLLLRALQGADNGVDVLVAQNVVVV